MEQWASRVFQGETAEQTALMNEGVLGQVTVIDKLLDLDYSQVKETFDDDKQVGTEAEGRSGTGGALRTSSHKYTSATTRG
jgi:hypothetical protein